MRVMLQTTGMGRREFVWVWDPAQPDVEPTYRAVDDVAKARCEELLAEYAPAAGQTWGDVMDYLMEKAHWQHVFRNVEDLDGEPETIAREALAA